MPDPSAPIWSRPSLKTTARRPTRRRTRRTLLNITRRPSTTFQPFLLSTTTMLRSSLVKSVSHPALKRTVLYPAAYVHHPLLRTSQASRRLSPWLLSPTVLPIIPTRTYAQVPPGGPTRGGFPGFQMQPQHQKGDALKEYVSRSDCAGRPVSVLKYVGYK